MDQQQKKEPLLKPGETISEYFFRVRRDILSKQLPLTLEQVSTQYTDESPETGKPLSSGNGPSNWD